MLIDCRRQFFALTYFSFTLIFLSYLKAESDKLNAMLSDAKQNKYFYC